MSHELLSLCVNKYDHYNAFWSCDGWSNSFSYHIIPGDKKILYLNLIMYPLNIVIMYAFWSNTVVLLYMFINT